MNNKLNTLAFAALAALGFSNTTLAGVGEGAELFDGYCSVCHGGLGEGQAMGKALTDTGANRLSDKELLLVITDGRPGTGMAAWKDAFSEEEIFDIASYVRTLQGKPGLSLGDEETGVSDDPMVIAGENLFNNKAACATCHSYKDNGGSIGPVLDGVAARLSDSGLMQALEEPSTTIVDGFGAKVVTQNDGTKIQGRYRNDSELAVQIQSADGRRWVTYFKDRVASIEDAAESVMPNVFITLDSKEQQQIVAFLKSL
jgi:putative heme-binding domain-containing protein